MVCIVFRITFTGTSSGTCFPFSSVVCRPSVTTVIGGSGGPDVDDLLASRDMEAKDVNKNPDLSPSGGAFALSSSTIVATGEVVKGLVESTTGGVGWPSCLGTAFMSTPDAGASRVGGDSAMVG